MWHSRDNNSQLRPTRYFAPSGSGRNGNSLSTSSSGSQPPNSLDELNPSNLLASFSNGVVQGFVDQISRSAASGASSSSTGTGLTSNNPFLAGGSDLVLSGSSNDLSNLLLSLNLNSNNNARSGNNNAQGSAQNRASANEFLAALLNSNNNSNRKISVSGSSGQNIYNFPLSSLTTTTQAPHNPTRKVNFMRNFLTRLFPSMAHRN